MTNLTKVLGLRDVVLMNVVAVVGLRWISLAAAGGNTSITLWVAALLLFFVPQACAVIELTSRMPEEGGLYLWTKRAFGDFHGFMAGWCYWTNNLVYFPNLLVYVAGISVFVVGSQYQSLGGDKTYVLVFSLAGLWLVTIFNVIGLKLGRWVGNLGGLGTWITGAALILMSVVALVKFGAANPMPIQSFFTDLLSFEKLSLWAAICFGFTGLELASVLAGEVRSPGRTIPRAVVLSGVTIAGIYVVGTLALLVALPAQEINIISGFLQGIAAVGERIGVPGLSNLLAILITLGGIGGLMAWFTGAARMPFVAGVDRFLPKSFGKIHPKYGSPYVAVLAQAVVASLFTLMSFVGATVEEAYLVLLDTTLLVYFVPYLYMFATYLALRRRAPDEQKDVIVVPRASGLAQVAGWSGLLTTVVAMGMSLVPPEHTASVWVYELKVAGGFLAFLATGAALYWWKSGKGSNPEKVPPF